MSDSISKLTGFFCYKVLPLTYDNSLSYYEQLCKITEKLNEAIEIVNTWVDNSEAISSLQSAMTQAQADLTAYKKLIDQNADNINSNDKDIDALQKLTSQLDKTLNELIENYENLYSYIQILFKGQNQQIDARFSKLSANLFTQLFVLQGEIDDLSKQIEEKRISDVYNYSSNKRLSFDDNNTKLYIDLENAISAEEYCSLNISAEDYAKQEISAEDYMRDSKKLLHYFWVYMPVSGVRQEISNALTEGINEAWGTMTAAEYADLELDADRYVALDLTNTGYRRYNGDSTQALSERLGMVESEVATLNSTPFVKVGDEVNGLTAEEYSKLDVQ